MKRVAAYPQSVSNWVEYSYTITIQTSKWKINQLQKCNDLQFNQRQKNYQTFNEDVPNGTTEILKCESYIQAGSRKPTGKNGGKSESDNAKNSIVANKLDQLLLLFILTRLQQQFQSSRAKLSQTLVSRSPSPFNLSCSSSYFSQLYSCL